MTAMSYIPTPRDIRLIRQAAELLNVDAEALFACSTIDGEWPDSEADAETDYQTLRTAQARLEDLAERMRE